MRNDRLALMLLACAAAAPVFAQGALPQCETTNFDSAKGLFTIISAAPGAVNQQCLLTIHPAQAMASSAQYPPLNLVEGRYLIELSGGGGGGGGGAAKDQGGGGGGAGAAPSRSIHYLGAGVYKLTIGTGGEGGSANGGRTAAGNPTSLTNANTGRLIYGFRGADVWRQRTQAATDGSGGIAVAGGSSGGDGGASGSNIASRDNVQTSGYSGKSSTKSDALAQSGGTLQMSGYAGMPGQSGNESGRSDQSNAGGGGGASVGSGGAGESVNSNAAAGIGTLGGGGGGGRGGRDTADAGGQGGHGFIKLALLPAAPVAEAPAAAQASSASAPEPRVSARPAKRDRN